MSSSARDAQEAKRLFLEAIDRPATERVRFLDEACAGDAELRDIVESLLVASERGRAFLTTPPMSTGDPASAGARGEVPASLLGPYKLLQVIGEGGFGTVYMAEQQRPVVRKVAVKVLKPGLDSREVIARFEAERQALALMDHPNIARVLDAGATDGGRPYFVMELVHGVPITQFCDEARLSVRRRLELFRDVCLALQHAHQKGVIHRDIKPTNVLVTMLDDKPLAKVIDFGIAKATHQRLTDKTVFTRFGQFLGTPTYMSPEQAQLSGLDVDTRSDVYSLGVLLYELLTGVTPFDSAQLLVAGFNEVQRVIREVEPPRPSTRLSTLGDLRSIAARRAIEPAKLGQVVRGDLDWVVMKCLEKDRARRYDSAGSLATDVERYLEDRPVEATPPSAGYRLRKLVRRHRAVVIGGSAVAATLVVGLAISTWGFVTASRERDAKEDALGDALQAGAAAKNAQAEAEASSRDALEAKEKEHKRSVALRRSLYVGSMGFANAAIQSGNGDGARELLDRCPEEERGWEWRYLSRLVNPIVKPVAMPVSSGDQREVEVAAQLAVSSDGRRAASGRADGRIVVWDTDTMRVIRTIEAYPADAGDDSIFDTAPRHYSPLRGIALSGDGRVVAASGSRRDIVKVFSVDTGDVLRELASDEGRWLSLAMSEDGNRLAARRPWSIGGMTAPTWWDLRSGERHDLPDEVGLSSIETASGALVFAASGRLLVGAGPDRALYVFDLEAGAVARSLTPSPSAKPLRVLEVSHDGKMIFAGYLDVTVAFDVSTGKAVAEFPSAAGWSAVASSPDDRRVALLVSEPGSSNRARGRVVVANAHTGAVLRSFPAVDFNRSLFFSPDGRSLFVPDAEMRMFDVSIDDDVLTLRTPLSTAQTPTFDFTPDGSCLVVGTNGLPTSADCVRVFDSNTGRLVHRFREAGVFALDPSGRRIAVAEHAGTESGPRRVAMFDPRTGDTLDEESWTGDPVSAMAFSPDGRRLAIAIHRPGEYPRPYLSEVTVWDLERREVLSSVKGTVTVVDYLLFSPDGTRLVTREHGQRTTTLFDASTGAVVAELDAGPTSKCGFASDGRLLAIPHSGNGADLVDPLDGRVVRSVGRKGQHFSSVEFGPDGRTLLAATSTQVLLWDLETGSEILSIRSSSDWTDRMVRASFTSDGSRVAVARQNRIEILEASSPNASVLREREDAFVAGRAEELVDKLRDELVLDSDVEHWLAEDVSEREDVRRAARAWLAEESPTHAASRLFNKARVVIWGPGESIESYRSALRWIERAVEMNPEFGPYRTILGLALYRVGEFERAVATLRKAEELNTARRQGGLPGDPAFLAMTLVRLGQRDAAFEALSLAVWRGSVPDWDNAPIIQHYLDEAEAVFDGAPITTRRIDSLLLTASEWRRIAKRRERLLGPKHPGVATAHHKLADELFRVGEHEEAIIEGRLAHQLALKSGEDHPQFAGLTGCFAARLQDVAEELRASGRYAEEAPLRAELIEIVRARSHDDGSVLSGELGHFARALLDAGRPTEAEPVARECLALREKLHPDGDPDRWKGFNATSLLGGALLGQGIALTQSDVAAAKAKLTEAEPHLVEGYEKMEPPKDSALRKTQALERLVKLYDAWETLSPGQGFAHKAELRRRELAERTKSPK